MHFRRPAPEPGTILRVLRTVPSTKTMISNQTSSRFRHLYASAISNQHQSHSPTDLTPRPYIAFSAAPDWFQVISAVSSARIKGDVEVCFQPPSSTQHQAARIALLYWVFPVGVQACNVFGRRVGQFRRTAISFTVKR